jgi:hypothetical protein
MIVPWPHSAAARSALTRSAAGRETTVSVPLWGPGTILLRTDDGPAPVRGTGPSVTA